MTTSRRLFKFSAPGNELTPEPSPKQKPNPETLTSGDSNFESATESLAPEPTRRFINMIEGGPQVETEQTQTEQIKLIEGGPQLDFEEEHDLLVKSSYFTEPRPNPPYSPIENLFSAITISLSLFIWLPWLNLSMELKNLISTNQKPSMETEMISKSSCKTLKYTWTSTMRHIIIIWER
jgi:hypothetical protein